jgi:hypothetical protein
MVTMVTVVAAPFLGLFGGCGDDGDDESGTESRRFWSVYLVYLVTFDGNYRVAFMRPAVSAFLESTFVTFDESDGNDDVAAKRQRHAPASGSPPRRWGGGTRRTMAPG